LAEVGRRRQLQTFWYV